MKTIRYGNQEIRKRCMYPDVLLVSNYWPPYNSPGTFRWWNFSKYIHMDVITPVHQKGFVDETLYLTAHIVKYINTFNRISFLNGIILSIHSLFSKHKVIIFNPPSESLLLGAYLIQKFRKDKVVIVDLGNQIDRDLQPLKIFVPIYKWLYKQIKEVVVCCKFLDYTKQCIYHGHDSLKLKADFDEPLLFPERIPRLDWADYNSLLENGMIPDYDIKMKNSVGYGSSSYINIKHLWGDKVNTHGTVHPELEHIEFHPWIDQADEMIKFINRAIVRKLAGKS